MTIRRSLYPQIRAHVATPEIFSLVVGPRQAGKTYLMKLLREELSGAGEKTISLNMDITGDTPFFASHEIMAQKIRLEIGEKKGYVFLDEIQRKENAGLFLKGLYDMKLPYKFVVSGSGSLELKEKIHESMFGRKRLFELNTLSFEEFIDFKTEYKYSTPGKGIETLKPYFEINKDPACRYLEEFLNFGGYPRVVLASTNEEKRAEIDEIYRSYLERDISSLLNLQKTDKLTNLLKILASQTGKLTNIAELSNTLQIAQQTVGNYLWYLEKTYILQKIHPYFKNIRKEITKSAVYYFQDLGLKNFTINQFGIATGNIPPQGFLFQNFVFQALSEYLKSIHSSATIHFWRTQDKSEVDFVIDLGLEVIPVEVKYASLKKPETTRSFLSFLTKYKPKKAFVIHLGDLQQFEYGQTKIYLIPYYSYPQIFEGLR